MISKKEQLEEVLTKAQNKCLIDLNGSLHEESPNPLYHYTSLQACCSILNSGMLRFTDIRYCNDPEELEDGLRILNDVSDRVLERYKDSSFLFYTHMKIIIYLLNVLLSSEKNEKIFLERIQKEFSKSPEDVEGLLDFKTIVFICCFSEKSDDLRQWIPYAQDGKGVALGFKGVNITHDLTQVDDVIALKVCYKRKEDKAHYVENLIMELHSVFVQIEPALYGDFLNFVRDGIMFDIIASKSSNYADELEWRFVLHGERRALHDKFKFVVKDNIICPYVDIDIEKGTLLDVKLGPKAERELNKSSLNALFKMKKYASATVSESDVKYR